MPDKQARTLVSIVHDLQESRLAEVDTKSDIKELEAKIERIKFDPLEWFIPLILGQAALRVTLGEILPPPTILQHSQHKAALDKGRGYRRSA